MEYKTITSTCDGGIKYTVNNIPFCMSHTCLTSDLDAALETTTAALTSIYETFGVPCTVTSAAIRANWATIMFLLTGLVEYMSNF
jgi:hypothetical protein